MKKTAAVFLFPVFMFIQGCVTSGKNVLYVFSDESSGTELYGYKDKKGNVVLDAVYVSVYTDEFDKIAFVVKEDRKITAINRKGEAILTPFIFDNGPDYIEEGLFRFVENDKIGFADKNGKIMIAAEYDFVSAFHEGLAYYSLGGGREYIPPHGEHWVWTGGYETGYINKKKEKFKEAGELENGKRTAVTFGGDAVILNEKGKIIETVIRKE